MVQKKGVGTRRSHSTTLRRLRRQISLGYYKIPPATQAIVFLDKSHSTFTNLFLWDVKEPTPLFEKSSGRRPRWCVQPLWVVGLARDGTLHGTYGGPVRAQSLWAGPCLEKLVKALLWLLWADTENEISFGFGKSCVCVFFFSVSLFFTINLYHYHLQASLFLHFFVCFLTQHQKTTSNEFYACAWITTVTATVYPNIN